MLKNRKFFTCLNESNPDKKSSSDLEKTSPDKTSTKCNVWITINIPFLHRHTNIIHTYGWKYQMPFQEKSSNGDATADNMIMWFIGKHSTTGVLKESQWYASLP